jgi:undecaprenyl-diphosphatase
MSITEWWHSETTTAPVMFYVIATLTSGIVGISCYLLLQEIITAFAGGTVVLIIGCLLLFVGLFQRLSAATQTVSSPDPRISDAILVGAAQGIAILPGITRSGMTTGTLLLRGYDGSDAFEYSFVLSIPAAIGAGLLAGIDAGLQGFTPVGALAAFLTAAGVGYLAIDALLRLVDRIAFWVVCIGLGGLAVLGGILVL